MGTTISKDVLNNVVQSFNSVSNSAYQKCDTSAANTAGMNIINSKNIDVENVDINQVITMDAQCLQDANFVTDIKNSVKETIKQVAESISTASSGNTSSETYVSNLTQLSNQVINNISQNCNASITNEYQINYSGDENITLKNFTLNQRADMISKCINKAVTNTTAANSLEQQISQEAKSINIGIFAIAAICALIGLLVYFMLTSPKGTKFVILLILVVLIILGGYLGYVTINKYSKLKNAGKMKKTVNFSSMPSGSYKIQNLDGECLGIQNNVLTFLDCGQDVTWKYVSNDKENKHYLSLNGNYLSRDNNGNISISNNKSDNNNFILTKGNNIVEMNGVNDKRAISSKTLQLTNYSDDNVDNWTFS